MHAPLCGKVAIDLNTPVMGAGGKRHGAGYNFGSVTTELDSNTETLLPKFLFLHLGLFACFPFM